MNQGEALPGGRWVLWTSLSEKEQKLIAKIPFRFTDETGNLWVFQPKSIRIKEIKPDGTIITEFS